MKKDKIILRNKIIKGLNLAYNRLLEQKQKEDDEFVFSKNGKIIKVKARNLQKIEVQLPK